MHVRTILTSFALLAVAACTAAKQDDAPATGTADDEAAIRAINTAYGNQWATKDTTAIFATMADDYVDVSPDGAHHADKAAAMAATRVEFAARPDTGMGLTVNTAFVKFLSGTIAVTGGSWTATGMPPGFPSTGSWTATVRKDSTGWKTVNSLASPFIPMGPPAVTMPDTAKK